MKASENWHIKFWKISRSPNSQSKNKIKSKIFGNNHYNTQISFLYVVMNSRAGYLPILAHQFFLKIQKFPNSKTLSVKYPKNIS